MTTDNDIDRKRGLVKVDNGINNNRKKAYLILENGSVFEGERMGATDNVVAEVVFATGMTGYIETLTDPSYYGQIIVQTFPLIGNYGIIPEDFESSGISASGYIVKHPCDTPSNFRSAGDLDGFLKSRGCVGLSGIDTRALTKDLREHGTMNGIITSDPSTVDIKRISAYRVTKPVDKVTVAKPYVVGVGNSRHIVLMDFGSKQNIIRELTVRNCQVTVVPAHTTAEEILALKSWGVVLSNGPGNPADNTEIIKNIRILMKSGIPMMGICLGHQLMALAQGGETYKLKYGHRGANQSVKDIKTGKVFVTSQNHGYAVLTSSSDKWQERFVNVNDGTCEGLEYYGEGMRAFSVQFHPEARGGPLDTGFLFDEFLGTDGKDGGYNAKGL